MVLQNLRLMIRLAGMPFAFVLFIYLVVYLLPSPRMLDHPYLWSAEFLGSALIDLLALIVSVMLFLARWYRFVMLGEHLTEIFPRRGSLFVNAAIKIGAVLVINIVLCVAASIILNTWLNRWFISDFLKTILVLILILGVPFFVIEVSLIFPAAVVGRRLALGAAWALLAGNHVRLFAAMLVAYLPFLVVQVVIGKIELIFSPGMLRVLVSDALFLASWFPLVAVAAVLLSDVYRGISGTAANRAAAAG